MILTGVQKRRAKIILEFDNTSKYEIYYDVYLMYSILKGDEISESKINQILRKNAEFEIKNSAFRYLANRNHSIFEIRNKLKRKQYDHDLISVVINELVEKKYLNDYLFATGFVKNRIERRREGIMKIKANLFQKGVSREIIDRVLSEAEDDSIQLNNALLLGEKKLQKLKAGKKLENEKIKSRIFNFLKGRGFTGDIILQALSTLKIDE